MAVAGCKVQRTQASGAELTSPPAAASAAKQPAWPASAASLTGSQGWLASAPLSSSVATQSSWPRRAAIARGVSLPSPAVSTWAPPANRAATQSAWPSCAAHMSAVHPSRSSPRPLVLAASGRSPPASSAATQAVCPARAAALRTNGGRDQGCGVAQVGMQAGSSSLL